MDEILQGEFRRGWQIAAARALLGWHQKDLARASSLHRNAITYWENTDAIPSNAVAVELMALGLARHGVIAVNEPGDGVVLLTGQVAARIDREATAELVKRMRELGRLVVVQPGKSVSPGD
jgi:transcriptional regulator with XRE-family HTH domain